MKKRILTGDRPTGKLHIGHLLGSLRNRVKLQGEYEQYVMIANVQALTDNFDNPGKVAESIKDLLCDYFAVGIDFEKTTVFIQSEVKQIHEIFVYLSNFVTIQQIGHNPTIKTELAQKGMEQSTPLGFFMYPVFILPRSRINDQIRPHNANSKTALNQAFLGSFSLSLFSACIF